MDTKITTFIFDCFGVFIPGVLSAWYRENSAKQGFVDENLNNILREFDLNNLSEEDIVDYFSKYEGVNSSKEKIQEEIDSYTSLNIELMEIVKKLKNKGFKIQLLSNANASFFERKIYKEYPEFKNLFDSIIISSEVKMVKPNRDIFMHALGQINSKSEESLFIDDNKPNVDSAGALGINGFVYTDNSSFSEYVSKLGINLD